MITTFRHCINCTFSFRGQEEENDVKVGKCMAKWVEKLQTTKMALMRLTTLQSEQQWFIVDYGAENDEKRNSTSKLF